MFEYTIGFVFNALQHERSDKKKHHIGIKIANKANGYKDIILHRNSKFPVSQSHIAIKRKKHCLFPSISSIYFLSNFEFLLLFENKFFLSSLHSFVRIKLKRSYGLSFPFISFSSSIPQSIIIMKAAISIDVPMFYPVPLTLLLYFFLLPGKYSNIKLSLRFSLTSIIIIQIHGHF